MGIHVQFNTDDLSTEDIAVLNALARSLSDPDWATAEEAPKRRTSRRAPAKAAAKPAETPKAEPEEQEAAEEPKEEAPKAAPAPKKAAPRAEEPKAEEKAPKPAPEPEEAPEAPADENDDEAEAVRLATALVHDGRGAEVREALKSVDAKKVSDLKGASLTGFLAAVREL